MPRFYVPARDPRHRIACFALYRALLRQAPAVVLPNAQTRGDGHVNPIKHLIRKGFQRNKIDVSPRLVTSSLANGYKFLDLLSGAREPGSLEHKTVLDFLARYHEHRIGRRVAAAAGNGVVLDHDTGAPPRPAPPRPYPKTPRERSEHSLGRVRGPPIPFLRRVPNPEYEALLRETVARHGGGGLGGGDEDDSHYRGALAAFAASTPNGSPTQVTPRFLYELPGRPAPPDRLGGSGVRRVPKLAATINGFPFLRVRKPQPARLGPALHALELHRATRIGHMVDMHRGDSAAAARLEDEWDSMMERLLEDHGLKEEEEEEEEKPPGGSGALDTYTLSNQFGIRYMQARLQEQRLDQLQRADLLWRVVQEEKRLAAEEREARRRKKEERRIVRQQLYEARITDLEPEEHWH